ncbi:MULTISPECIES: chemotaxis protein CheW [unclassified Arsukibacterium]|uniref:chemotaxis protein CheW n=1 Tax=unclassified Arsukibacterium TaxID=2635278 RepID=UPI000C9085AC|nr:MULTISPECIES: chemotaxis protein CheW [unclassified Arsukibacterium]MAA95396.1 chemotaxis protein CheW [Rheinheimera sp.]HAW93102.1 chemotaxis protein CheW [Candidatus Azambacteria bacterium]|tara:strand:+ start:2412 stop:3200 length:789 start_codon:yes stop_codon:yes gene_type:complete
MSSLIASQKVMQHYLSALLTDDGATETSLVEDAKTRELNRLLAQASPVAKVESKPAVAAVLAPVVEKSQPTIQANPIADVSVPVHNRDVPIAERLALAKEVPPGVISDSVNKAYRQGRFQALFFNVAGLKLAVPLTELGGIHQLGEINSLFGKPAWFKGIMLYRQQKISVVDSARWVMPEKYDQAMEQKLNYQYVIMLGTSNWGLTCETLINTFSLEQDEVKWRETDGKRPWMAGLIKKHMCALVDVDAMINLLNRGQDINA